MCSNESHATRLAVDLPASNPDLYLEDAYVTMPLAPLPHPALTPKAWRQLMTDARARLQQMWAEGINFFSKSALDDIIQQMDAGVAAARNGRSRRREPCLLYQTVAHLIEAATIDERALHSLRAYLPLEVTHWTEKCDAFTHVPVPAIFPTIPREAAQAPPRAQPLCGVSLRRSSDTGSRILEQHAPQRGRVWMRQLVLGPRRASRTSHPACGAARFSGSSRLRDVFCAGSELHGG
ncbi:hypothetical protein PWT90_09805 [Aphanocladium album]|nr:hypothetical protein PWT90_09805 [Aphanocladium album]